MRLFIALDFPESVADRLEEIAHGLPDAAWVPSHQYHLTLRFLGETDEESFRNVERALGEINADSFHLDLKSVGHFPLRGNPEVLWAGVAPNEFLLRLSHKVDSALGRAGIPPDGRKFHPHVTLARLKSGAVRHVGDFEVQNSLFKVSDVAVEAFHLYSSRLAPEGAVHTVEATYPLKGMLQEPV